MQDEEMDMRIKEAANQHHPPYDDKAWEKMEQLLGKHLPQKKDRKRWFFFLLLFLLLDAGILLLIVKPWKTNSPVVAKNNTTTGQPSAASQTTAPTDNATNTIPLDKTTPERGQDQQANVSPADQPVANSNSIAPANAKSPMDNINQDVSTVADRRKTVAKNKSRFSTTIIAPAAVSDINNSLTSTTRSTAKKQPDLKKDDSKTKTAVTDQDWLTDPANKVPVISTPENKSTLIAKEDPANSKKNKVSDQDEKIKDKDEKKVASSSKDKKKTPPGFGTNFGLTVSVGAELNYVSLNNPGKITMLYGAGLSYTFAKRFTVRAGFYVSKKVYPATPEQYNNTTYPYLDRIDANCRVYQIPLNIGYNFWQRKNHNWFASVGLSSLLMKKEDYKYEYKLPGGQSYSYDRTVDNENKHYFSVLSLSAGYQYNVNNHFSIMAEPFFNLPLKGIGLGKIKLNNAGAMLTLSVKPFAKKK